MKHRALLALGLLLSALIAAGTLAGSRPDPEAVRDATRAGLATAALSIAQLDQDERAALVAASNDTESRLRMHDLAEFSGTFQQQLRADPRGILWARRGGEPERGYHLLSADRVLSLASGRRDQHSTATRVAFAGSLVLAGLCGGWLWWLARGLRTELVHVRASLDRVTFSLPTPSGHGRLTADGSVSARLDLMLERVERALDGQAELLRSVSHELRTPLARLRFRAERLRRHESLARRKEEAANIDKELDVLETLVAELLSRAWLQHQDPDLLAVIELRSFLEAVVAERLAAAPAPGLSVEVDVTEECRMSVNEHLLARAVGNLVSNATRYARSRVRVSATQHSDGWTEIRVADDGPGINASEWNRALRPFETLPTTVETRDAGTGLGLSIVHQVLVAKGGRLSLHISEWGGCAIVIWWPPAPENTRETPVSRVHV